MMFVFYGSLGGWAVTTATYLLAPPTAGGLAFTTTQVGWIYSTFALGAILANPLVGLLADRLFPAQRVFSLSTALCGLLLLAAGCWCQSAFPGVSAVYRQVAADEHVDLSLPPPPRLIADHGLSEAERASLLAQRESLDRVVDHANVREAADRAFLPLFCIMLLQSVALQISLTLTTVISLRNLDDPGNQFSRVRMWGTVGWIVINMLLGLIVNIRSPQPFFLSGMVALLVGIYGLTLPNTPPKGRGKTLAESFGLPALQLFRDPSFVVFLLIAWVSSITNQFYGVYGHKLLTDMKVPQPERWMTLGQLIEVAIMFLIPLLKPKQWMKWLMLLGLFGWVIRGLALMAGSLELAVGIAVPMHGWSYAFFFIVAATYIDREAPPHLRASTQAIVSFVVSGVGPWTGNMLAAWIIDKHRIGNSTDWPTIWLIPTIICAVAFVLFLVFFRPPPEPGQRFAQAHIQTPHDKPTLDAD